MVISPAASSPTALLPLHGRACEVAEIAALLARDDVRLVTITGPGGIGKTRVAQAVAAEVGNAYPGGVWWVSLAEVGDAGLVLPRLAATGGVVGDLAVALEGPRVLAVLDNFEHLMGATASVLQVLTDCPGIDVLVTSRTALRISAERRYDLPLLNEDAAIALLRERAERWGMHDGSIEDAAAREICRRLDHLPLAIELAAARLRLLSPEALVDRLGRVPGLLGGGSRDVPDRQRTLDATLAWSCALLASHEQRLFTRLAIFAGGFTLDAAEAVCDAELDTLDALVNHSLVRWSGHRFTMLATIHEHAARLLAASDELPTLAVRHAAWYAAFADAAQESMLYEPDPEPMTAWLLRFEAERHNLRAAIERALGAGQPALALAIVVPMWMCWETHGLFADARRTVEAVVAAAAAEELARYPEALETLSEYAMLAGDLAAARAAAVELVRVPGLALRGRFWLAEAAWWTGDLDEAEALYRQTEAEARAAGEACYEICARSRLVAAALRRGDAETAKVLADGLLAADRELRHFYVRIGARQMAGWAQLACGNLAAARAPLLDAAQLLARTGWTGYPWRLFAGLACTWAPLEPGRAAQLGGFAEATARRSGERVLEAEVEVIGPFLQMRENVLARLGQEGCDAARELGAALSFDEAFTLAVGSAPLEAHGLAGGASAERQLRIRFGLTPREVDVLRLIGAGLTNRQIAETLFISPKTTSVHVSHVLAKLGVPNRVGAAGLGHQLGLASGATRR